MKKLAILLLALLMAFSTVAFAEDTVITYASRDAQIPATVVIPEGLESYPLVVLCHGHGGSREENVGFAALAEALKNKGIASIRMDFPGCGESKESFQKNTLTNMKADVLAAIDYMKANYPVTQLGLFGYSMGGRIALELLAEGLNVDALALLAPAAGDIKNLFGGEEGYANLKAIADKDGFATFTTIYGQTQELSKEWFEDLAKYEDVKADAAAKYAGPTLVIYGSDDEAVNPAISAAVAETFSAKVVDATGEGHGYGFYSETDTVRNAVAAALADFCADSFAYTETVVFIEAGDHKIPATVTVPKGEGKFPAVIMLHGNGSTRHEAGNAYDYTAPEMAKAGIATIRFDYIGNGDSASDYIDFTYDKGVEDAMTCYEYLKTLGSIDMEHVGIMGWSQGGRLTLLTAGRNDVFTSVLTWAGAYDQKLGEEEQYKIAQEKGYYEVTYDWREPLKQSPAYYECAMNIDYAAEVANIKAPILAIAGSEDNVVPPEVAQKIVDAAVNSKDAQTLLLEGADHTFCVFTGDMTVLENLTNETIAWFLKTL